MRGRWWVVGLTGAYAVLWFGGVLAHLLWGKTPERAGWTAPAFLGCAAALVLVAEAGARRWLVGVGMAGLLVEMFGATTGLPFGRYSYTDVLQPQLAGVPAAMFCAWVILIAYVRALLAPLGWRRWRGVAIGAAWMTAIDLAIDPVATRALDFWRWHTPGDYYGVPLSNFAGWFVVSAFVLASGWRVNSGATATPRIGRSVVLFFGFLAAAHGLIVPSAVAFVLVALDLFLRRAVHKQPRRHADGRVG
jgi:uncharacterized membrane protein